MAIRSVEMSLEKECKHSVKYASDVADLPFDNIYIQKTMFPDGVYPKTVTVTVEAKAGTAPTKKKGKKAADADDEE